MSRSRGAGRSCKAVVVEEATAREIIGCEHTRQSNRTMKTRKQKQCVNGKKNFFYWLLPTNQQLNSIQKKTLSLQSILQITISIHTNTL